MSELLRKIKACQRRAVNHKGKVERTAVFSALMNDPRFYKLLEELLRELEKKGRKSD